MPNKAIEEYLEGQINDDFKNSILVICAPVKDDGDYDFITEGAVHNAILPINKWLEDNDIGSLDERWNWLEGWTSGHNNQSPYAVHYTRGGPWFDEWQDVEFAKEWINERDEYLSLIHI